MNKFLYKIGIALSLISLVLLIHACESDDQDGINVILNPNTIIIDGGDVATQTLNVRLSQPAGSEVRVKVKLELREGAEYGTHFTLNPVPVDGILEVVIPAGSVSSPIEFTPNAVLRKRVVAFHIEEVQNAQLNPINTSTFVEIRETIRILPEGYRSIKQIRDLNAAGTVFITENVKITGTVISAPDIISARELVLQDHTSGLNIRFGSDHSFQLGDSVNVSVQNAQIVDVGGLFQLQDIAVSAVEVIGSVDLPQPKATNIGQLLSGALQSQRVLVRNANFPQANGTTTFNGERTIADNTGSLISFTRNTAPFATDVLPVGDLDMVVVPTAFVEEVRVLIMRRSDIGSGGVDPGPGPGGTFPLPFFKDFNDCSQNFTIPADFIEALVPGSKTDRGWGCREFGVDGSRAVRASSFGGAAGTDHAWLITEKKIDFAGASNPKIEFWIKSAFDGPGTLRIKYSENYNGAGNPLNATWVEITALASQFPDKGSGDDGAKTISTNVSALAGKQAYIAFEWDGGTNAASASYDIDNLNITAN